MSPSRLSRAICSLQVVDHQRGQPLGGLVEEQQLGVAHERAGDGEHLLLAPGEKAALPVAQLAQLGEELVDALDGEAARAGVRRAATSRFSHTVSSAKMRRSSGTKPMPSLATW